MKRKSSLIFLMAMLLAWPVAAQRIQQRLGRGVVASRNGSNTLVSWRRLAQEPEHARYNVYVNGSKLNASPLEHTNYRVASSKIPDGAKVTVSLVVDGVEGEQSTPFLYKQQAWDNVVCRIDFETSVLTPNDYKAKYAWPADLDGDGEYEWIVDRLSTADISTRSHKLQAYRTDGTCLWTVDLGPNVDIDAGQNDMVLAYDINCDGKAEVIIRSSDGTRFWDKAAETWGKYVGGSTKADVDGDGIVDYATQSKRNPPYYISIIDGLTGEELEHAELNYAEAYDGANRYARDNRASYKNDNQYREYAAMNGHFAICYFDGIHPSLASESMVRDANGTHHVYVFSFGYDWSTGKPENFSHEYTWSRNDKSPWPAEFHMVRVCDVDGDGIDELIPGGYAVNTRRGMVYSAGISHGDRFRLSDIDPDRPGLETFAIQQSDLLGQVIYDAATGEHIKEWYLPSVFDVARGECMDVDASHKGYEIYSFVDRNLLFDCKGDVIRTGETDYPYEGIWWDGDLLREVLGSPGGSGYGSNVIINKYGNVNGNRFLQPSRDSGWQVHAGWAVRPLFMGDIMGDWREEVALMIQDDATSTGMVVYSTDLASNYSMYCLQEDPHYRLDCTTRGYYQAPNTGFYLGADMPRPQLPPCMVTDVVLSGRRWAVGSTDFTDYNRRESVAFRDGHSVLIDLRSPSEVSLEGSVSPSVLYAMPVRNQRVEIAGSGSLSGDMELWKSQQGTLVLSATASYTGRTVVSEGTLESAADLTATPIDLRARGTLSGTPRVGDIIFEGALNREGCRLSPGTDAEPFGTMTFTRGLTINQPVFMQLDLQTTGTAKNDLIHVEGDIHLTSSLTLHIVTHEERPEPGEYTLMEYTGNFEGDIEKITVMGLTGLAYRLRNEAGRLTLVIDLQREASAGVVWTGSESNLWDYRGENFSLNGEATEFVAGDEVEFNDNAERTAVTLNELLPIASVLVNNDTKAYTFNGDDGGWSGEGGLTKKGSGALTINNTKSTYTGPTALLDGRVTVKELANGGRPSSLGAAPATAGFWQLGKATLIVNNPSASTDRMLTLTDTATVQIASGTVALQGRIDGDGMLVKSGAGQLTISYAGANTWRGGTQLAAGTLAMGAWNTTFGTATSPITVTGNASLTIFNNNSTSAVPTFQHKLTINQGRTLTMNTGQRCKIQGTLLGSGTLAISFPYVRGDFSMNCSAFEGTVNVTSGQFRLTAATDLSKATLRLGAGVYAVHTQSQSATETNLTTKVGSLSSTATDAILATGTWNVGYLGKTDSYAGKFTGTLHKYGDGTMTMTGQSTGALYIHAGRVQANTSAAALTTATTTVQSGGTLGGTGRIGTVVVQRGGTLAAGTATTTIGTLTVEGNLTLQSGASLLVKARPSASTVRCDAMKVSGKASLASPAIEIQKLGDGEWAEGQELVLFTTSDNLTVTGTPTLSPAVPAPGLCWETSRLASEGIIAVVADPDPVIAPTADELGDAPYYTTDGRRATPADRRGIYVRRGEKRVRK